MRVKLFAALLAFSTAMTPAQAHAGIIEFIVTAIAASTQAALVGIGITNLALLSGIGTLIISGGQLLAGLLLNFAVNALFAPDAPKPPTPERLQGNFAQSEAPRLKLGGELRVGGSMAFAETKNGGIYKLIAHGDSECTTLIDTYVSDIPATYGAHHVLSGTNWVNNPEFQSRGYNFYRITSRAGTGDQAAMSDLTSVFPEWTAQHIGAGVADTLLHMTNLPIEDRARILRHGGSMGLGEPNVTRAGLWGRYYDPRNDSTRSGGAGTERVDDPSTWGPNLGNPILFAAEHRIDPERFANNPDDIDWDIIAREADVCDETVIDRYGNAIKRYTMALAINKANDTNLQAEDWILQACDGIRIGTQDGKIAFLAGKWDSDPDLVLTDRDIISVDSEDAEDGESLSTHYLASYTEPAFGYKATQSAVTVAPDFEAGDTIRTQVLELYQLTNHNQACRITYSAVHRQHEKRRLAVKAGWKALKAKTRRFLRLATTDPLINGIYEIAPVGDTYDGQGFSLGLIRCDTDRWPVDASVEGERPNQNITVSGDADLTNIPAADMVVQPAQVLLTGGESAVRLVATFVPPARADILVQIQHRQQGASIWEEFSVRTEDGAGASAIVSDGAVHEYRWRVYSASGNASPWAEFVTGSTRYTVTATADTTPPGALVSPSATGGTGEITYAWTAPNSTNYYATRIWLAAGAGADFSAAVQQREEAGLRGDADSWLQTGVSAGDHTAWLQPVNGSGVAGTLAGPFAVTVT